MSSKPFWWVTRDGGTKFLWNQAVSGSPLGSLVSVILDMCVPCKHSTKSRPSILCETLFLRPKKKKLSNYSKEVGWQRTQGILWQEFTLIDAQIYLRRLYSAHTPPSHIISGYWGPMALWGSPSGGGRPPGYIELPTLAPWHQHDDVDDKNNYVKCN